MAGKSLKSNQLELLLNASSKNELDQVELFLRSVDAENPQFCSVKFETCLKKLVFQILKSGDLSKLNTILKVVKYLCQQDHLRGIHRVQVGLPKIYDAIFEKLSDRLIRESHDDIEDRELLENYLEAISSSVCYMRDSCAWFNKCLTDLLKLVYQCYVDSDISFEILNNINAMLSSFPKESSYLVREYFKASEPATSILKDLVVSLATCGDFETQCEVIEIVVRCMSTERRHKLARKFNKDDSNLADLFIAISCDDFERAMRFYLMEVNRKAPACRVFSFSYNTMKLGESREFIRSEFSWIDIGFGSQKICFYRAQRCEDDEEDNEEEPHNFSVKRSDIRNQSLTGSADEVRVVLELANPLSHYDEGLREDVSEIVITFVEDAADDRCCLEQLIDVYSKFFQLGRKQCLVSQSRILHSSKPKNLFCDVNSSKEPQADDQSSVVSSTTVGSSVRAGTKEKLLRKMSMSETNITIVENPKVWRRNRRVSIVRMDVAEETEETRSGTASSAITKVANEQSRPTEGYLPVSSDIIPETQSSPGRSSKLDPRDDNEVDDDVFKKPTGKKQPRRVSRDSVVSEKEEIAAAAAANRYTSEKKVKASAADGKKKVKSSSPLHEQKGSSKVYEEKLREEIERGKAPRQQKCSKATAQREEEQKSRRRKQIEQQEAEVTSSSGGRALRDITNAETVKDSRAAEKRTVVASPSLRKIKRENVARQVNSAFTNLIENFSPVPKRVTFEKVPQKQTRSPDLAVTEQTEPAGGEAPKQKKARSKVSFSPSSREDNGSVASKKKKAKYKIFDSTDGYSSSNASEGNGELSWIRKQRRQQGDIELGLDRPPQPVIITCGNSSKTNRQLADKAAKKRRSRRHADVNDDAVIEKERVISPPKKSPTPPQPDKSDQINNEALSEIEEERQEVSNNSLTKAMGGSARSGGESFNFSGKDFLNHSVAQINESVCINEIGLKVDDKDDELWRLPAGGTQCTHISDFAGSPFQTHPNSPEDEAVAGNEPSAIDKVEEKVKDDSKRDVMAGQVSTKEKDNQSTPDHRHSDDKSTRKRKITKLPPPAASPSRNKSSKKKLNFDKSKKRHQRRSYSSSSGDDGSTSSEDDKESEKKNESLLSRKREATRRKRSGDQKIKKLRRQMEHESSRFSSRSRELMSSYREVLRKLEHDQSRFAAKIDQLQKGANDFLKVYKQETIKSIEKSIKSLDTAGKAEKVFVKEHQSLEEKYIRQVRKIKSAIRDEIKRA